MARGGNQKSSTGQVGSSGALHSDPYNEVNNHDPNEPDTDLIYDNLNHVLKWHTSQEGADLENTPNSKSGMGINGGPTPGEAMARNVGK